jgi:recombination protein RecT
VRGAAPPILGLASAPTARADSQFTPDRLLVKIMSCSRSPVKARRRNHPHPAVIHTPGHAANHLCLVLLEDGLLFSGDHILNGSTTVIDPPDGNMTDYLDSLDRLDAACAEHGARLHPARARPCAGRARPGQAIAQLKAHRLAREAKVLAAMQADCPTAPWTTGWPAGL